nr:unnamed protein product [Callosobruchus chinensis]
MNISSNTNFEVLEDLTGQIMATALEMPQPVLQPPPLLWRMANSTMQVVDDDIVCIESDSEDTQSNTSLYTDTTDLATTVNSHSPNLTQGKIVTIRKNDKIVKVMIPRNVMPNMSNSPCPVTLNIPGIGPLKLKIDPFVKNNASSILPSVNTIPDTLSPFSLNFDDIHHSLENSKSGGGKRKARSKTRRKSATSTSKRILFCSVPNEGIINTLGFTFTECRQPKNCLSTLNAAIKKFRMDLTRKMNELKRLTNASKKSRQVKMVPVSEIIKAHKGFDSTDTSDHVEFVCDESLLVTRKIVILNDGNRHEKTVRRIKRLTAKTKQPYKEYEKITRPCYVAVTRDPYIEKLGRDIPSKLGNDVRKSLRERRQDQPADQAIGIEQYFIDTESKFRNNISYKKPVTVINEHNYKIIKSYKEEFCRTNIVYALKDGLPQVLLRDANFVDAVVAGYVKLVDDELLCSYFLGDCCLR